MLSRRRTGQFFLGELSHPCPKIFSTAPEKTAMLTCKITLPDSPHPIIINNNPGFRALHLARRKEFRFFSFNKYLFHFWLLASARKIMVLPESGGGAAAPAIPLARTLMVSYNCYLDGTRLNEKLCSLGRHIIHVAWVLSLFRPTIHIPNNVFQN